MPKIADPDLQRMYDRTVKFDAAHGPQGCFTIPYLDAHPDATFSDFVEAAVADTQKGPSLIYGCIRHSTHFSAPAHAKQIQRIWAAALVRLPWSIGRGWAELLLSGGVKGGAWAWDRDAHQMLVDYVVANHKQARDFLRLPAVTARSPVIIRTDHLPDPVE